MKLVALSAACASLALTVTAAAAHDAPAPCLAPVAAHPMELTAMMQKLNDKGYHDISEIKRRGNCYKVKARTDLGEVKVYVSRDTGEVVNAGGDR